MKLKLWSIIIGICFAFTFCITPINAQSRKTRKQKKAISHEKEKANGTKVANNNEQIENTKESEKNDLSSENQEKEQNSNDSDSDLKDQSSDAKNSPDDKEEISDADTGTDEDKNSDAPDIATTAQENNDTDTDTDKNETSESINSEDAKEESTDTNTNTDEDENTQASDTANTTQESNNSDENDKTLEQKKSLSESEKEQAKVIIDEIKGIDTFDLDEPQGNWLFKRIWWQRAETKYEKIKTIITKIFEQRMNYFIKRDNFEKNVLNPFYIKNGVNLGQLKEQVNSSINILKNLKSQKNEADTINKEIAKSTLEEDLQQLERINKEISNLEELDSHLDQALIKLLEQINLVHGYESDAWKNFKEIARVLDDRKARQLYFNIEVNLQNTKEIQTYIEQAFSRSFKDIMTAIQMKISQIESLIKPLKEKELILTKQIKSIEKSSSNIKEPKKNTQKNEPQAPSASFLTYITTPITWSLKTIWAFVSWPIHTIFGSNDSDEDDEEKTNNDSTIAPEKVLNNEK